jgi:hypothetical protein
MGQVLHRSATTTEAVRRAIQHSQESMRTLAKRHGINPKTVAEWKKRESTADRRTCPTVPRSRFCRSKRKRSSWRFASARCCRSTTASTHSRPRFLNLLALHFIAVWNVTASADCLISKAEQITWQRIGCCLRKKDGESVFVTTE